MNEEVKEAIEELNEILKQWQQIINIENEEEREIEMSLYFEEMPFKDIQIALNLIDKLQKENEELKNKKQLEIDTSEEVLKWKAKYHLLSRKIDVINKDKIREKIKELGNGTYDAKIILEKLLEDNK